MLQEVYLTHFHPISAPEKCVSATCKYNVSIRLMLKMMHHSAQKQHPDIKMTDQSLLFSLVSGG